MLNASDLFRILIEDEQPVPPPGDPNQPALASSADDLDPKSEVMRYADEPFTIRSGSPTDLYQRLTNKLGTRPSKKVGNNTYVVRHPDRLAVKFHQTDVVTAFPDGRIVVNSGGWKPGSGGHGYNPGWRSEPGTTTMARMNDWLSSGWQIYRLKGEWYWYNRGSGVRHWESDTRLPYTDGDHITPEGALQLKAHPVYVKRRRKKL